jgi:hypothetical protein
MICPACGAKYPTSTVRCRKCEVLLVPTSRDADARRNGGDSPSLLWSGADAVLFSALVDALSAAEIPLHQSVVHDSAAGTFGRFPLGIGSAAAGYEIRVAEADLGAAQSVMDSVLASAEEIVAEEEDEELAGEPGTSGMALQWRAADAIAEVWRGENGEWAVYLCDVLRENQIRARVASEPGAPQRVLVRPAEEAAARRVLLAIEGAGTE